jgi:hypothetical protein
MLLPHAPDGPRVSQQLQLQLRTWRKAPHEWPQPSWDCCCAEIGASVGLLTFVVGMVVPPKMCGGGAQIRTIIQLVACIRGLILLCTWPMVATICSQPVAYFGRN